ncbi:Microbial collagenase, secreted [Moritella sp. JT01]|uniref:hypothetical protein n=1 Tax=Moritella sp. JT01 TaxID=756698 RepID=UPI0007919FF5|nr:hypothetical protein [Moritella sp. JT01]KXO12595.1 Microbial collagenase, secreted [Moritella sp. JT01]
MTLVQSTAMAVLLSVFLTACGGGGGGSTTTKGSHTKDTDGDGVIDSLDAFPNDKNETKDSDGDGVGDNADAFPNNKDETKDSDGDSVGDNADAFPNDKNETKDSDGDGVGDNADAFPNDKNETKDSDGDGVGDNADAFPNDKDAHSYKPKFDVGFSDIVNLNDDANTKTEKVENIARLVNEAYDNTVQKIIAAIADESGVGPESTLEGAVATWNSLSKKEFDYTDHKGIKYSFSLLEYHNESSFRVMIRSSIDKDKKERLYTVPSSEFFKKEILESNTDDAVDRKLKQFSNKPMHVRATITVRDDETVWMNWSSMRKDLPKMNAYMDVSESIVRYIINTGLPKDIPQGFPSGNVSYDKNTAELKLGHGKVQANYIQNKDTLEWIK